MHRAVSVAVALALAAILVAVVVVSGRNGPVDSVADLDRSDCVDAPGFVAGRDSTPDELSRVDCDEPHDAEVLVSISLDARQARNYGETIAHSICVAALDDRSENAVATDSLLLVGLADDPEPARGDTLACLAFESDRSQLDGRVVRR